MKAKRYLTLFAVLTLLAPLPSLRASGSDDTSTKQDDKGSNSGKDSTSDKTDDKGSTSGSDSASDASDDKGTTSGSDSASDANDDKGTTSGTDSTSDQTDDKGTTSGSDSTSDKTDDKGGTTTDSGKDRGDGDHNAVPETETDVIRDKLKEFEAAKEAAKLARKTLVEKLDTAKTEQERKDILDQLKEVEKLHDKEQRELAKQVREELKRDRRNRRTN